MSLEGDGAGVIYEILIKGHLDFLHEEFRPWLITWL